MTSFRSADEIVAAYEDQVEALERLFHARALVSADPRSRFYRLSDADIQVRLEQDREELDRWAVLMLMASFEGTLRGDAKGRIQAKTRDGVRKPLRDLHEAHGDRVRLDDLLAVWEACAPVGSTVRQNLRILLKHRHWLAHGRHWTNKYGSMPSPLDAHAYLYDYVQALQASVPDFPRI
ncbi:hypothetical protein [Sorangium sp. So ce233]|uniref:hypothetical protein n=1 Tax=Sorangium sp. So ce233 TaxID=3133290 RepID=UPI003F61C9BD